MQAVKTKGQVWIGAFDPRVSGVEALKSREGLWGTALFQSVRHSLVPSTYRKSLSQKAETVSAWLVVGNRTTVTDTSCLLRAVTGGALTHRPKAVFLGDDIINAGYRPDLGRFRVQGSKGKSRVLHGSSIIVSDWIYNPSYFNAFIFCLLVFSYVCLENYMDVSVKCQCNITYCCFIISTGGEHPAWADKNTLFSTSPYKLVIYMHSARIRLRQRIMNQVRFLQNMSEFQSIFLFVVYFFSQNCKTKLFSGLRCESGWILFTGFHSFPYKC